LPEMARVVWTLPRDESPVLVSAREHKRAGWERAIRAARAGFSGELLFAAAEPVKVDWVDFWPDLDGVGSAFFPTLSGGGPGLGAPSAEQTKRQFRALLDPAVQRAREMDQPLWILPTGFRSTAKAWAGPGLDGGQASRRRQGQLLKLLDEVLDGIDEQDPGRIGGVLVWRSGIVPVTNKFMTVVCSLMGAVFLIYLFSFVAGLFGVEMPMIHGSGPLAIGFSLVVIVIVSLMLMVDFEQISRADRAGAPKYMEWFFAMGLLVTLVWLYYQFLHLLSALRD